MSVHSILSPSERVLRPNEAAAQLGIGGDTLYAWARSGKIASIRDPGGRRKYPQAEVDRIRAEMDAAGGAA